MSIDFWKQTWEKNEIGFHESKPNPLLVAYFKELNLVEGSRVFLPLCGKALDIAWLLSKGYRVTGAELSKLAIKQLFIGLGVEPEITECGNVSRYSAKNIDIFVGDIFDVSSDILGPVDAIYDRAALVALPEEMRKRYTKHILEITDTADQILITFEYDQSLMDGPPFSLNSDEISRHYKDAYNLALLESISVPGGLKGICAATESIWLLKND
ncbi:MAG: thiopurine S-methyltransferase [Candidatus Scalindua rubra]|uniref:Thiopurine S-methyltransferase n=1 Tax=Candidatus Scalindua brodae TaxID=237368 RepID=A0A0B0EF41_9BACT|nr:MAG: Thiopurine S-methyltransferase [Candidatus Scalindua brodae]MBZ0109437.1 thiopurine S-methyltransferase [Candidatus Scalindua rubra]TWU31919.1 Thiopurine S-methyltransferase [Candidatus Brocadiaceae bacterium S225]